MSNSMSRMRISETAPEPDAAMYRLAASIELDKPTRPATPQRPRRSRRSYDQALAKHERYQRTP